MIFTERTITIRNDSASINTPVILYRGDKNVEVRFTLVESPYKYSNRDSVNIIESTDAAYAQLIIKTPNDRDPIFGDITAVGQSNIIFVIEYGMIDEIGEVGEYDFQIRLFDSDQTSMVTLPEVVSGFIIKEPIAKENATNNITNSAIVDSAVVTNDTGIPTFVSGSYNKTAWHNGTVISRQKLDKIEDGIYETYELSKVNNSQIKEKVSKGNVSVTDINKALGKFDQTYFTDEFLQQMAGSTPINAVPADYSITQKKMVKPYLEAIKGKNLFDKSTTTEGKYVNMGNGILSSNTNFSASDFIEVKPNTTYTISGTQQQYALYDGSKTFTRGIGSERTFTSSETEAYVRISLLTEELNSVQVELGSIATSYEDYITYYLDNDCITKVPKEKVDIETIDYVKSVNLFDKSTITEGKYINMGNGKLSTNVDFSASDFIEVEPNTTYCLSSFNTGTQGAYYDDSKVFISGLGAKVTTSPSNAKYMRFGCPSADVPTMQLQKGQNTSEYEPYGANRIPYESISYDAKLKLRKQPVSVKKVSLDGSCDYTSIANAVDEADKGTTIQVMPGVYDNTVKGFGKDISIIGVDKKRCVLKNTTGDYNTPPLEMTHGYLANMTIYAEKLDGSTDPSMLAYAMHIDRSYSRNKTLLIENCDFYSDWNACAGIGTWSNFTLTFRNCNFYMNNPNQTNGAVFCHNSSVDGELNQHIIFDNCRMYSKSNVGMYIGDAGPSVNSPLNMTFINTLIYSDTKGKDCIKRTSGSEWAGNNIRVTADSYGNNNTILNGN